MEANVNPQPVEFVATADWADRLEQVRSCDTQFNNYGGRVEFCGPIFTLQCFADNALVREILGRPGGGGVLVIDGGANYHNALLGDLLAARGRDNGWSGVVINGVIRDSAVIGQMDFGCKALGTNPRKSAKHGVGEQGGTLSFGGIDFVPGQYLFADQDGVVVVTEAELQARY